MSRWFVGSSRSIRSGLESRIFASSILMFQPCEKVLVGLSKSLSRNPSPRRVFWACTAGGSEASMERRSLSSLYLAMRERYSLLS